MKVFATALVLVLLPALAWSAPGDITRIAGPDANSAYGITLTSPRASVLDSAGNLYIANTAAHSILKVDAATGMVSKIAGTYIPGFSGDGSMATAAQLNTPAGIALDTVGNLYIADQNNHRIRKIDAVTGTISTIVGTGVAGFSGDGGAATAAQLYWPSAVIVDSAGNLYIADSFNNRVRKVDAATGIITTVAGGGVGGDGGLAMAAAVINPHSLAMDSAGNLYIGERTGHRIRMVDSATGIINTIAGTGLAGFSGDGGAATAAQLNTPEGIVLDTVGNLYIADSVNHRIRKVDAATGIITTVAGNGLAGFMGEGGAGTAARLNTPYGVNVDSAGNLYISDSGNHRIRKVDAATGIIATVAGGTAAAFYGDGGAATAAALYSPTDAVVDALGNVYIADSVNARIRKVDAVTGIINTVAGTGLVGFSGDGGAATAAQLYVPTGVAVDINSNLYIADSWNNRIRKVDAVTGVITTVAGIGTAGFSGDGATATTAQLNKPDGITVDSAGNLYISDTVNHRIRKVDVATGIISTVAGNGTLGFSGDGAAATLAQIWAPKATALDSAGNLYIADSNNHRIRKVDAATGIISTVAGTGVAGFSGDGAAATLAQLNSPSGVGVDVYSNLYLADYNNHRIRKVDGTTGIISTVAGYSSIPSYFGDGTAATLANLAFPMRVTVDVVGNLYIADTGNGRIRKVEALDTTPPTGSLSFGGTLTNNANATLSLTCNDGTGSGCSQMMFSTDGVTPGTWVAYATTYPFTLVEGPNTAYVSFKDAAGNASGFFSASIALDTVAPAAPVISAPITDSYTISTLRPAISGTAEMGANATIYDGGVLLGSAPATGGNWSLTGGTALAEGVHSFYATATDTAGNTSGSSTIVRYIVDATAPVITLTGSADVYVEAGATYTDQGATSSDAIDGPANVTAVGTVNTNVIGIYTLTYDRTDTAGNAAVQVVRHVHVQDTTAPVFTGAPLADVIAEATGANTAVALTAPAASDLFAVNVTSNAPAGYPVGTTVVTWTATDANGNSVTATQNVIVRDTTLPVISGTPLADVFAEAAGLATNVTLTPPGAIDLFGVTVTSNAPASYPLGTTVVTWTATDANGNFSTTTQNVVVTDTTAPIITLLGSDPYVMVAGGTYVDAGATAFDSVDGDITGNIVTVNPVVGGAASAGIYTVTYNVSDAHGNAATLTRTVEVTAVPVAPTPLPASGGGGGGCVINPNAGFDPTFGLLMLLSLAWVGRRRIGRGSI